MFWHCCYALLKVTSKRQASNLRQRAQFLMQITGTLHGLFKRDSWDYGMYLENQEGPSLCQEGGCYLGVISSQQGTFGKVWRQMCHSWEAGGGASW